MTDAEFAAAMAQLWAANRTKVLARGALVLAALEDAAAGRPFDRVAAAREAHTLAGTLGTYGRPGSALFAEVERALSDEEGGDPEPEADLGCCAGRVRRALEEI